MSKGSVKDARITLKPSMPLIEFIASLADVESMPENVLKIYQIYKDDRTAKSISKKNLSLPQYTTNETELLKKLNENPSNESVEVKLSNLIEICESIDESNDTEENIETLDSKSRSKTQTKKFKEQQKQRIKSNLLLNLNDIKWINSVLTEKRKENLGAAVYLHELMEHSQLILPKNEIIERNPELEARCQKLRMQQDAKNYRNMTRNVDSSKRFMAEDTIAYQVKQINRQLIAVLQFIFSVLAGFAFGFIGIELIIGNLDFGFRLLLGIMIALIIALAEIYFLAKRLNEEYDLTVEPPKVVYNAKTVGDENSSKINNTKEHAD